VAAPARVAPRGKFKVSGKLSKKVKRPVVLQVKKGKKWVKLASGKATKKGRYKLTAKAPSSPGVYSLRIVAKKGTFKVGKKTKRLPRLVSKSGRVTVAMPVGPLAAQPTPPAGSEGSGDSDDGLAPLVVAEGAEVIKDQYIVVLNGAPGSPLAADILDSAITRVEALGGVILATYDAALIGYAANLDAAAHAAVRGDPQVEYVGTDHIVDGDTDQSSPSWGLDRIDQRGLPLDSIYSYEQTGAGVTAYIIDSGIRRTHTEFSGRVGTGFGAVNDGNGTDDCHGHGTHVAGTVGGTTYGVAKAVTLVPVRVLGCNNRGSLTNILKGVNWVTANHVAGKPAVANMSIGTPRYPPLEKAISGSIGSGVTYAVAGGNDSGDACKQGPAHVSNALTVGATTSTDERASYSNWGSCLDLFAPGSSILSAGIASDTASTRMNGTSMATPHVAGAAARFLQNNPKATPAQVAARIIASATVGKVTDPGKGSPNRLLYVEPAVELTLSPASITCANTGCAPFVTVTTNGTWGWNSGYPSWVTLTRHDSQTLAVTVTANPSASTRTGTISVTATASGQTRTRTVSITQLGGTPPTLTLSPTSITCPNTGCTPFVTVSTNGTWGWESGYPSWVTLSRQDSQTLRVTGAANPTASSRSGTISVTATGSNGLTTTKTVSITQPASTPPTLTLSPTSITCPNTGCNPYVTVSTNGTWGWNSGYPSWVTLTRQDSQTLGVRGAANTTASSRSGTISVTATGSNGLTTTKSISITQPAGSPPTLTLSPTSITCPNSGCNPYVTVSTNGTWSWSSGYPSWVTLSRQDSQTLAVKGAANPTTSSRSGTITVNSTLNGQTTTKTVSITQPAGVAPTLTLSPTSISCPRTGCSPYITVTTNGTWAWDSGYPSWVTLSRVDSQTIRVTVPAKTTSGSRSGTISVTSRSATGVPVTRSVSITQAGT